MQVEGSDGGSLNPKQQDGSPKNDKKASEPIIYNGLFIADEIRKGKGGFIKCKQLDKKIEVNLKKGEGILHQTEVQWQEISRFNRKEVKEQKIKDRLQKRQRMVRQMQSKKSHQYVEKGTKPIKKKYVLKQQLQEKKEEPVAQGGQSKQDNQSPITAKIGQLRLDESSQNRQADKIDLIVSNQPRTHEQKSHQINQAVQTQAQQAETVQAAERASSSDSQSAENEGKKDKTSDITIVGKIVRQISCPYWQKPFVCLSAFKFRNDKNKPKKDCNQTNLQRILSQCYLDFEPIHSRLPTVQVIVTKQTEGIIAEYLKHNLKIDESLKAGKIRNLIMSELESIYYLVKFKQFDEKQPIAELIKIVGKIKTIDGECNCFLQEHELKYLEYDQPDKQEAKVQLNPSPYHSVFKDAMVFTIDPPTSIDLDDALSIRQLQDNLFEVGIHIADVSSYLHYLDRQELVRRATSVYLPHKTFHMLPERLTSICSLNPRQQRLAFSIIVKINGDGEIVGESQLRKHIITSRFKLSYDQVQDIITGKADYESFNTQHPCDVPEFKELVGSLGNLVKVGMAHRKSRIVFDIFQNKELKFQLDKQNWPTSFAVSSRYMAKKIVEEFMIIGNIEAAKKLVYFDPTNSLVIHHPRPSAYSIQSFNKYFKFDNLQVKFNDVKQLQNDMLKIKDMDISDATKQLCYVKARRAQEAARYKLYSKILVEEGNSEPIIHFALGLQYYTHFTSPMRRIGDIIVHETLNPMAENSTAVIKRVAGGQIEQANKGRTNSKRLKKDLNEIYLCLYIYRSKKEMQCEGIVSTFGLKSISIYIPILDLIKEVMWKDLDLYKVLRSRRNEQIIQVIIYHDKHNAEKDIIWELKNCEKILLYIGCTEEAPLRLTISPRVQTNHGRKCINHRQ